MFRKKEPSAPEPPGFEAMAAELNPRGTAYAFNGMSFPPGAWVPVTAAQADLLKWFDWITVRPVAAPVTPAEEVTHG